VVVTLGERMRSTLLDQGMVADAQRVIVIPTWVDTGWMRPIPKESNPKAVQWGQIGHLTVMYSGNIGYTHDIGMLLDAAAALQHDDSVRFVIVGDGPGKADLLRRAEALGLSNVCFHGLLDSDTFGQSLPLADVSIVSIRAGVEGLMMPSKTYFAMAAGCAVLGISCPPNDLDDVIREHGCGLNVRPEDIAGLVEALDRFNTDRAFLDRCKHAARRAAEERYSRSTVIGDLAKIIDGIASETHAARNRR